MGLVKLNDRGVRNATTFGSVSGGSMIFIKKLTASASATLDFLDGASDVVFDDTYKEYLFTFNNIHLETDVKDLQFQADTGTNTAYNQTITSSMFRAHHLEDDTGTSLTYQTDRDLAQSTSFQSLTNALGNGNDECVSGTLSFFNPSSTTFVKHFMSNTNEYQFEDITMNCRVAGYFNTTTALTRVQFKISSGNIDAGDICLYGIK